MILLRKQIINAFMRCAWASIAEAQIGFWIFVILYVRSILSFSLEEWLVGLCVSSRNFIGLKCSVGSAQQQHFIFTVHQNIPQYIFFYEKYFETNLAAEMSQFWMKNLKK